MASPQQISTLHKTASHADDFMTRLYNLQQVGRLTDVTIKGQQGQVRCHSQVLYGNSDYFERMLESDMTEGQTKVITFPEVNEKIIENIVDYFYNGEIQITADNAEKCLELAEQMEITALVKASTAFVNNCIGFYKYGSLHELPTLVEKSEYAILTHFSDVSQEDEFLALTSNELIRFINDDNLIVQTEDTVYEAVMRWVKSSPNNRTLEKLFVKVIEHVRFPFCSSTFLRDVVSAEELMDNFKCYKLIQEAQIYHMNPEKAHDLIKGPRMESRILKEKMASLIQTSTLHKTASHADDVMMRIHNLQQEGRLNDVTIKGQQGQVRCHSQVLYGNSAYFERILESDMTEGQTKVITFSKVNEKIIENLLQYFFNGEIQITADNAEKCLDLAEQIEITALVEACTAFMVSQVDVNNCIRFYKYGSLHQLLTLVEKSEYAILTQFGDVSKEDEFLSLIPNELIRFLKDDSLRVKTEDTVYEAVMRWVKFSPETRTLEKLFVNVIEHVRFPFCSPAFLRDVVSAEELMDNFKCHLLIQEAEIYQLIVENTHNLIKGSRMVPRILTAQTDILVFGGTNGTGSTLSKPCYKLNQTDNEWNKVTELPSDDKRESGACLVNNGILICGGGPSAGTYTGTCWFYDLKSGPWEDKADMILPRNYHTLIAVEGDAVCCGGRLDTMTYLDSIEKYSFALNKWDNLPNMLQAKAFFPSVFHDNKVLILGGYTGSKITSRCQRLDVASQMWTSISDMPAAVCTHSAVMMGSYAFLVGGLDHRVCYRYSVKTDQFTQLTAPVPGYSSTAAVVHQGNIVLLGNENTSACVAYSVERNTWSPWKPALPGPLKFHHAFNVI